MPSSVAQLNDTRRLAGRIERENDYALSAELSGIRPRLASGISLGHGLGYSTGGLGYGTAGLGHGHHLRGMGMLGPGYAPGIGGHLSPGLASGYGHHHHLGSAGLGVPGRVLGRSLSMNGLVGREREFLERERLAAAEQRLMQDREARHIRSARLQTEMDAARVRSRRLSTV